LGVFRFREVGGEVVVCTVARAYHSAMSLRVLVIRHGVAEEKSQGQGPEEDKRRHLTAEGATKMRRAARGLAEAVKHIDLLATSPLDRAAETAEIVGEVFGVKPAVCGALAPQGRPAAVVDWLKKRPELAKSGGPRKMVAAVVGHEPDLGVLVSWMLSGMEESFVDLKKGAACLVEFEEELGPGRGKLLWSLRPGQMRRLRRSA
jgi:phosphohistidine phosphatase